MTSFRQIEANRRNALKSTGPTTEAGKQRSRRNALRHGLSAETVVGIVEEVDDYKGFEAAIMADYDARTAVERELVLRLASLLWRIRRATSIETELLTIQAEILHARNPPPHGQPEHSLYSSLPKFLPVQNQDNDFRSDDDSERRRQKTCDRSGPRGDDEKNPSRLLAHCFERLADLDNGAFERLNRYEAVLMRQIVKTLILLR